MKELDDLDPAMHAALDPLTTEERQMFSDDMDARFPDAPTLVTSDPSAAMERGLAARQRQVAVGPARPCWRGLVALCDLALLCSDRTMSRRAHRAHDGRELRESASQPRSSSRAEAFVPSVRSARNRKHWSSPRRRVRPRSTWRPCSSTSPTPIAVPP